MRMHLNPCPAIAGKDAPLATVLIMADTGHREVPCYAGRAILIHRVRRLRKLLADVPFWALKAANLREGDTCPWQYESRSTLAENLAPALLLDGCGESLGVGRTATPICTNEIDSPEARLQEESWYWLEEHAPRCPDQMHVHLLRDEDITT
ncbi:hypothetical protein BBAD15_g12410 [Beauveria bassiana D1-5]|uniref:Uncharacterized protein n=1 Tax=Beauveria bassiana D1-5 TaxID=1245745 RepID=A0A0A2V3L2_BEABA|nr:hypothetical protein BBAD15_g12410 [Beauveria bassiana D1-5]